MIRWPQTTINAETAEHAEKFPLRAQKPQSRRGIRRAVYSARGGPMSKLMLPLVLIIAGVAAQGRAQDRLPPIAADRLTDAQKQAIAEFKAARGVDISGPFVPLLRSPEVMNRARAMGDYLRFN